MNILLSQRNTTCTERMDDPNCDLSELKNTYRQFSTINGLISQWKNVYKQKIRPLLDPTGQNSLLDIGFGGGDIPLKLAEWSRDDGFNLQITAIDPDPRAFGFIQELDRPGNVEFLQCRLSELDPGQQQFDFVISNHLIHHLDQPELTHILELSKKLSTRRVIFNDIRRDDRAYLFFNLFSRPVFRSSFITADGLTSIKRSYTTEELANTTPPDWEVQSLFPFRILLTYNHE